MTGKGGVGKTLVASGLAVAAAKRGRQALYVEFGDGESGARTLGAWKHDVKHVVLDPTRAVVDAAAGLFGSRRLAKLALGNFAMRPLIEAAPAVRELAVLELARQVVAEHPGARVVFDMPATGHSVAWLRVVREVKGVTARGPLHELCLRLEAEILSSARTSMVVVTLPERLVLSETLSLCDEIETDIGLSVDRLVVNRVPTPLAARALVDVHAMASASGPAADAAKRLAGVLQCRMSVRQEVLDALDATRRRHHGRGEKDLTLLPSIPREPKADLVADWLVGEEAA